MSDRLSQSSFRLLLLPLIGGEVGNTAADTT